MKTSTRILATITGILLILVGLTGNAEARTVKPRPALGGFPACVTTTWASHYFHQRKTRKGEWCVVGVHVIGRYGPNLTAYWPDYWTPASYKWVGVFEPVQGGDYVADLYVAG